MNRDAGIYVDHMLEAITNIETDTAGYDFEKFGRIAGFGNSSSETSKSFQRPAAACRSPQRMQKVKFPGAPLPVSAM